MTARLSIVPADAFEDDRLTPADVRVLGVLGTFLDRRNECFPSQALVAQRAKLNRVTVNKSLRKLADYGYVQVRQRWPGKAKSVLVYHVLLDQNVRSELASEQPGLFSAEELGGLENSTKSHVAKNNMGEPKPQQNSMLQKATCGNPDVASRGNIDVASGGYTELPKVTPHLSVSNETDDLIENDLEEPVPEATAAELQARIIFGAGVLLLTAAKIPEAKARSFLGKLRKDFGTASVAAAVTRAASELPTDPQAWLRKACEVEARRRGVKLPTASRQAHPDDEADRIEALDRRMAHVAGGGLWAMSWGKDPRLDATGVPPELYQKHRITPPEIGLRNA
jgi:hypothetical protein